MSDLDYFTMTEANAGLVKNLAEMGNQLKQLKLKYIEAEALCQAAKKEYEYYAENILPTEMFNAGVQEVKLATGGVIRYEKKYYCQPNKNEEDKRKIAEWLRTQGGDSLIKARAAVDASQIPKLNEAGVQYTEINDFNTQTLKAFIRDLLGENGGEVKIKIEDIPACVHFQEHATVEVDL